MSVTELKQPKAKKPPRYFETTVSVDTDVEIHADDLHEAGWHHEDECPAAPDAHVLDPHSLAAEYRRALEALHREAHGPGSITVCPSQPCAALSLDALRSAA